VRRRARQGGILRSSRTALGASDQVNLGVARNDDVADRGPAKSAAVRPAAWWQRYASRVLITDAVAIYIAVFTAYVVRFDGEGSARVSGEFSPSYIVVSIVLMWAWIAALLIGRTQERRAIGDGPTEYQRVASVTWRLFAAIAVVAYLLRMEIGRSFLGIAFPLGLGLILLGRVVWRSWLTHQRAGGAFVSKVLVVGHRKKAERFLVDIRANNSSGFVVVGVCLPEAEMGDQKIEGAPVLGSMDEAGGLAKHHAVDMVAVVGSDAITADAVKVLGWDLEGAGIDLALTTALGDIAGPRVVVQPVNGLPLIYVDEPHFSGPKYALKSVVDWIVAFLITVALFPLLAVVAASVAVTSPGGVFYSQERIGVRGQTFRMLKFRSMTSDAHDRLQEVLESQGQGDVGLFYKPKNDPRVTPVGRFIRKHSIDELPQLFNVLRGEMSLVGPRPQIDQEVALYDRKAHRRLLVKPGLTGLWQVSGRSELTPEEGIRMDVYYVENWTLFGDLVILARTARVVLTGEGAY
jgi:exopolysaccharide biosynthesis polyprenyl glycosylphosphotransferase